MLSLSGPFPKSFYSESSCQLTYQMLHCKIQFQSLLIVLYHIMVPNHLLNVTLVMKVSKGAKIRNR